MPDIKVYIREKPWSKLMIECRHDRKKALRKIAQLVNEKYG